MLVLHKIANGCDRTGGRESRHVSPIIEETRAPARVAVLNCHDQRQSEKEAQVLVV
jgi:hypothetical protein